MIAKMEIIEVMDANVDDVEGIREVSRISWMSTFPNERYGITSQDIERRFEFKSEEDRRALIEDRKKKINDPGWHYWVAKDGEKIVGFSIARVGDKRNILQALHVLADYQGKGIGGKLMQKALDWLGSKKDIELSVAVYNEKAISFYEKFGFVKTGRKGANDETVLPSGKYIPQMEMVLKF